MPGEVSLEQFEDSWLKSYEAKEVEINRQQNPVHELWTFELNQ
jgi:hypothetical protein